MTISTFWQWSKTAASNVDVAGIGLSNSMTPTQLDDAMRAMMGHTATGLRKGSDVASGTTTTLGDGVFFHITGTTTITDIDFTDAADGRWAWLEFDGALTLTHNGTTLTIPGARNITTAAGDRALIVQDSSDNVHVLFYQPYIAMAPYITPWVVYTPTYTGFGTVAATSMWSRRVGDTLEIMGRVTVGTPTATEARMTLGFNGTDANVTSDATKVASIRMAGAMTFDNNFAGSPTVLIESNVGYITFGSLSGTSAGLTKLNGSSIVGAGWVASIRATIPISGW